MFGWLSGLFSTKSTDTMVETGSSLLKDASSGIDMLFFTEEEKSIASQQAVTAWLKMMEATRGETSVRGITRRLIAVPWMYLQMALIVAAMAGYFFDDKFSILCVDIIRENLWVTGSIVVFYFGTYAAEKMFRKN